MFRLVFLLMVLIRQCSGEEDRLMVQSDADSHSDEYVDHINKLNSTWKVSWTVILLLESYTLFLYKRPSVNL